MTVETGTDGPAGTVTDPQGRPSCWWHGGLPDYVAYHDAEWGRPVADDIRLFEKICLEGFQSGLSWLTILRKRDGFRAAFAGFDFHRVAAFDDGDVERLVADAGIVRHRGKIVSTINNARRACEMADEFGSLAAFLWRFEPDASERPPRLDRATLGTLAQTPGIRCTEQSSEKARLELRRPDDDVRVHAGGRYGQRPYRRVLGPRGSGGRPGALPTPVLIFPDCRPTAPSRAWMETAAPCPVLTRGSRSRSGGSRRSVRCRTDAPAGQIHPRLRIAEYRKSAKSTDTRTWFRHPTIRPR